MHFNQVTLILIAATGALATPLGQDLEARNPDLALLHSEAAGEGENFEVWGKREAEPEAKSLNARKTSCASGTITPVCDTENGGQNALCLSLISYLSSFGTQSIPSGSKQLCYTGSGGKCCTGWNVDVPSLNYNDLVANAQSMYQTCSGSSGNSGKMNGVKLYQTCANQCLNNGHTCS